MKTKYEFTDDQIERKRSHLAKVWKQSKSQILDIEAIHYLRCERDGKNPEDVTTMRSYNKERK